MLRFVSTFSLLLLLSWGCTPDSASEESEDASLIEIYVRYLEAEQSLLAEVKALKPEDSQEGGHFIEGGVQLNGKPLEGLEPKEGKTIYSLHQQLPELPDTLNFSWKGQPSVHLPVPLIESFAVGNDQLSLSEGGTLSWALSGPTDSLSLILIFTDAESRAHIIQLPQLEKMRTFSGAELPDLPLGTAEVYLTLSRKTRLQSGPALVHLRSEYFSKSRKIEILP